MRFQILIFLLFHIRVLAFCQTECAYENYFKIVGEASFDAFSKNYEPARSKYKDAFSKNIFPLGQDLRKALKVAKHFRDTIWIESLAIQLAKGGIPISYFEDLKEYPWYGTFQQGFPNYIEYYKSNFDLNLKHLLLDIRTQDSIINDNYHKWRVGKRQMTLDELTEGAKGVFSSFSKMYEKYGFPSEHKMGYYYLDNEIQNYPIPVVLIHIYQRGVPYLDELLGSFVCQGKVRPEFKDTMMGIKGFGSVGVGIEKEMQMRYDRFKSKD